MQIKIIGDVSQITYRAVHFYFIVPTMLQKLNLQRHYSIAYKGL